MHQFEDNSYIIKEKFSPLSNMYDFTHCPTNVSVLETDDTALNVDCQSNQGRVLADVQRELEQFLPGVHGVMIGRAAYNNPLLFATADSTFYGVRDPCLSRRQIVENYIQYCEWAQSEEGPRRIVKGKEQMISTMVLLNAMRNSINGLKNVNSYRQVMNDEYVKLLKFSPNPSPRAVVSSYTKIFSAAELYVTSLYN